MRSARSGSSSAARNPVEIVWTIAASAIDRAYSASECAKRPVHARHRVTESGHGDSDGKRTPGAAIARADARALSGRRGPRRARRSADLLRGLRRRRADAAAPPALVARALALLEGTDPVPGPP